jgi:cytochrome P450
MGTMHAPMERKSNRSFPFDKQRLCFSVVYGMQQHKEHARERRILQTAFTPSNLRGYVPRVQALAENIVKDWATKDEISIYEEARRYVTRVASDILAGFDERWTSPEGYNFVNQCYLDIWKGFISVPFDFPGSNIRKGANARLKLQQLVSDSLSDLIAKKEKEGKKLGDAVRDQMQANSEPSDGKQAQESTTIAEVFATVKDEDGKPLTRQVET